MHLQQQMHLLLLVKISRETTDVGETTLAPPADRNLSIQKMSQDQKHHEIGPDSTLFQAWLCSAMDLMQLAYAS